MNNLNIFYDLIGYLAIIISVLSFNSLDKNKMRKYGLYSTILFGISIYSYNGLNGLFVSIVSSISKIVSISFDEVIFKYIKPFIFIISIIFFINFNPEGIIGILPALSLIFIIYADFQDNILNMKYIYFGSVFCWLIYSIILGSIPGILFDIVGFIILINSIIQIKKEKKNISFSKIENCE